MALSSISAQLKRIENDIVKHLSASKEPLTQDELYERSSLGVAKKKAGLSSYGWPFALENLERAGKIKFVKTEHWELVKVATTTEQGTKVNSLPSLQSQDGWNFSKRGHIGKGKF